MRGQEQNPSGGRRRFLPGWLMVNLAIPEVLTHQGVLDAAGRLERRVEGVDRRTGHTERVGDALALEDLNCRSGSGHTSHRVLLIRLSDSHSRRAPR